MVSAITGEAGLRSLGNTETHVSVLNDLKKLTSTLSQAHLTFSVDQDTSRLLVRVIDKVTNKTLCQVPPEISLHLIKAFRAYEEKLGKTSQQYTYQPAAARYVFQIIDNNKTVVYQIPAVEALRLAKIWNELELNKRQARDPAKPSEYGSQNERGK